MNKREKELYGKKQWKHTNPIETLNKSLEDINFGKNGVLLSIGANDYETEKVVSKSFKNNELIIATDVRGYNADMLVNSHLLVLKDKIDAELFTIDDFNKFIGNNNYTNRQRNPYVVYDRLSALWYSLYKGKTHITKKILDNYIEILSDGGYLITDCYEHREFINFVQSLYNHYFEKKYQKSTYELFKYYIDNIDLFVDKKFDEDKNKLNHLMVISKNNILSLSNEISKIDIVGSPVIEELMNELKFSLIILSPLIFLLDYLIMYFIKLINCFNPFMSSFSLYILLTVICFYYLRTMKRRIKEL